MPILAHIRLTIATIVLAASVAVLVAMIFVASSDEGRTAEPAAGAAAEAGQQDPRAAGGGLPTVGDVSGAQAAALADGVVTRAEYEAAVWSTFNCIRDLGSEPLSEPAPGPNGNVLQFSFVSNPGSREAALGCHRHHSMLVEMSWAAQNTPSADQAAAAREAMQGCLLAAGFPAELVDRSTDANELAAHGSPAFGQCYSETVGEFGTSGY